MKEYLERRALRGFGVKGALSRGVISARCSVTSFLGKNLNYDWNERFQQVVEYKGRVNDEAFAVRLIRLRRSLPSFLLFFTLTPSALSFLFFFFEHPTTGGNPNRNEESAKVQRPNNCQV